MSERPGKRLVIHSNAHRHKAPTAPPRSVSKTEYALRKTLAISLSVCLGVCGIGVVLLLLTLPYSSYMDTQYVAEHGPGTMSALDVPPGFVIALSLCIIFIPILLVTALPLWLGSRKSWKTVRALQPINFTDTSALPEVKTLLRPSDLPSSHQRAELLRGGAPPSSETPPEELLRATLKGTNGKD